MRSVPRARFWIEVAAATASVIAFVVTLVWHDWIEALGVDPDAGSGAAEWLVAAMFPVIAIVAGGVAGFEWRRHDGNRRSHVGQPAGVAGATAPRG